jgi:multiple sugar transport system ATP-binding protein
MRTELQRLQRQLDVTTIYVTHDQEEAMTMSDRIAVINQGVLQQIAPPLTCYNEPANLFVAGFIGSPSMNFFEGRVDGSTLAFDSFDIDISNVDIPDGMTNVTLGVRQEDVYPADQADSLAASSEAITATVDVLEPIGEQIFVYLDTGVEMADVGVETEDDDVGADVDSLLMGVEPDYQLAEGDEIEVVFDRSKLHLFDTATGEAIAHDTTAKQIVDEPQ